ncbi:sushi, von Willebrand factor type A, EGF and pentraxin domain-containing protein 1-like [Liolophura sinensis]|uniref:sushi, von Willebrand factor type A, EGF and pentraxin domain-containing protein 1-like n=1 Tax=Liolophura sinensis TaxID=3198878 RepID=UPI0031597808
MMKMSLCLIRHKVTVQAVFLAVTVVVTVARYNDSVVQQSFESVGMFSQKYGSRPVDLVFVLDRSASIPPAGWQSIMAFVYSVLEHFTIDAQNTRVAVITYSTRASVDINDLLNERENKCSLMQRLRQSVESKVPAGYTATHSALKTAYDLLLNSRRGAKKAVIVLTDGRSNIGSPPVSASVDIRSLKWSPDWDEEANGPQVEIFAFGVHDAYWSELQSLSGQLANHTYFLPEFSEYRDLAQLLHKGGQVETWEITGRAHSCSANCSPHSVCMCSTGSGQYMCVCKQGYQGNGHVCEACPVGQYKASLRPGLCDSCPGNLTTLTVGSVSSDQCGCKPPYSQVDDQSYQCHKLSCSELPSISNGHGFHVWGMSRSEIPDTGVACENTAGDSCHFICDTGYRLNGLPALVCDLNGTWMGEIPECKVVDCGRLQDHGEAEPHAIVNYLNRTTTYGSVVTVSCEEGWQLFGSERRICNFNGQWSGALMKCVEARCPVLPSIPGGEVIPLLCSQERPSPGTVCMFSCREGFDLIGPEVKTCGNHGHWDNNTLTACKDTASPEITCPEDILVPATAGNFAIVYWDHEQPHVSDNSGHFVVAKVGPFMDSPANVQIGVHQIKYLATDNSGNTAFCLRTVQVVERTVRISGCPDNITLTNIQGLGQRIEWTDPQFFDHHDQLLEHHCSRSSGSFFGIGTHHVTCYPLDRYDQACRFTVNLERTECERPPPPLNGAYSCSSTPTFLWVCSVHCDENYSFYRPPLTFYHCNLNGQWNDQRLWPHCSRRRFASRAVVTGQAEYWFYEGRCEEVKERITELFKNKVEHYAVEFCLQSHCEVTEVDIQCGHTFGQRIKRDVDNTTTGPSVATASLLYVTESESIRQDKSPVEASQNGSRETTSAAIADQAVTGVSSPAPPHFSMSDIPETMLIRFNIEGRLSEEENVTEDQQFNLIYNLQDLSHMISNEFHLNNSALDLTAQNNTLASQIGMMLSDPVFTLNCEPGQVTKVDMYSAECVNCPVGTYLSGNQTGKCVPCPVGQYQDREQQLECRPCPEGLTTAANGTANSAQCREPCPKGSSSPTGLEPCDLCDVGHFQDERGQSVCQLCPDDQKTVGEGADSVSSCKAVCPAGSYNGTSGLEPCDLCPQHMYQPASGSLGCLSCPENTGTLSPGTTDVTMCNRIDYCSNLATSPCENGGECESREAGFTCNCAPGYTGQLCGIDINECASSPCYNNATCEEEHPPKNMRKKTSVKIPMQTLERALLWRFGQVMLNNRMFNVCPKVDSPLPSFLSDVMHSLSKLSPLIGPFDTCLYLMRSYPCTFTLSPGSFCEHEVDECSSNPCQHGGSCEDLLAGFNCYCALGWTGPLCETDIDECQSNPCSHGTCENQENGFVCHCPPGYVGVYCETAWSVCTSEPCQNDGVCQVWPQGRFTCLCEPGFLGKLCDIEIDECNSQPCLHGATCFDRVNGYRCQCPAGYKGDNCQTVVSPDFDLVFSDSDPLQHVTLHQGLTGFPELHQFTISFWLRTTDARNFGTILSYMAYTQEEGSQLVTEEEGHDKVPGVVSTLRLLDYGRLKLEVNGAQADTGIRLTTGMWTLVSVNWENTAGQWSLHLNHSLVVSDRGLATGTVIAGEGYLVIGQNQETIGGAFNQREAFIGELSQMNIYDFVLDSDLSEATANQEHCTSESYGNVLGWTHFLNGVSSHVTIRNHSACLDVNECLFPETFPCGPRRQCQDFIGGYNCEQCIYGYHGSDCDQTINECIPSPCLHGASCVDGPDIYDFICTCTNGFTGALCGQTVDSCKSQPCLNNGTCHPNGSSYWCECVGETSGSRCEDVTGPCEGRPCMNGGLCLWEGGQAMCVCPKGFSGDWCELETTACSPSLCHNGGTCLVREEGHVCSCPPHYTGQSCDVQYSPSCELSPCLNNGTCVPSMNSIRGFMCVCSKDNPHVTWDAFCDFSNPCQSNPCGRSGVCVHFANNSFQCSCSPKFTGRLCDVRVIGNTTPQGGNMTSDPRLTTSGSGICAEVTCYNGGSCFELNAGFVCQCTEGYKGKYCTEEREKEFHVYVVTVRVLTDSPDQYTSNRKSFEKSFVKEVLSLFTHKPVEGRLDARLLDLRTAERGLDIDFELVTEWYKDSPATPNLLTTDKILSSLKNTVTQGNLGAYVLSREKFHFEEVFSKAKQSLTIYLSTGVAAGVVVALTLLIWLGCKIRRNRRIPPRPPPAFSTDSYPYNPCYRPSILNNTHEMVILNPIGNPAYQSESDVRAPNQSRPCIGDENPYAELVDVPLPYAVTSKAELKEAFMLRRYSSKRSKESNIELAAARKASQDQTSKKGDNSKACAVEDDYLKPVTLPRNEFSKDSKPRPINQLGERGDYLHPQSLGEGASTLPVRLFPRANQQDERPPDYLEVCPPLPDDVPPSSRLPREHEEDREAAPALIPRSPRIRGRQLPPLPPIPVDDEI